MYEVIPTERFEKDVKYYVKKKGFVHIGTDIKAITDELEKGNLVGTEIPGLKIATEGHTFKVRSANSDTKMGQSNGYRIIYYAIRDDEEVYLLTMCHNKLCYTMYTLIERMVINMKMKQIITCVSFILLLGCLTGCSSDSQSLPEHDNSTIAQESTQTSIVSEALGNSENNSNLSSADKQQMFAPYEQYGLIYDATQDILLYNDKIVRWFEDYYPIDDNGVGGIDFLNESGTVDVYAVRDLDSYEKSTGGSFDSIGTLVGLKEFSQDEFNARNIDSLRENASIAVTGNPLENSEIEKFVAEYEEFGITYDFTADQWYFNGEEVRYFWDVLISNGESLTSGKFNGELRTLGNGNGIVDIYTIRDYDRLNSEGYGTLTGIEKYSQEEFDEHTHTGIPENQSSGTATK